MSVADGRLQCAHGVLAFEKLTVLTIKQQTHTHTHTHTNTNCCVFYLNDLRLIALLKLLSVCEEARHKDKGLSILNPVQRPAD